MSLKISVEKIMPVGGNVSASILDQNNRTKVNIEQIVPFGNVESQTNNKVILVTQTPAIYDAFIQVLRDEVVQRAEEVKTAHTHIHADRDQVRADRTQVDADKKTVAADKATVANDKKIVDADKKTVAADKATVSNDKAVTTTKRNEAESFANQALSSKNSAASSASTATTKATEATSQANRAKQEADRAKSIADGININGGSVTGNLTVSGTISEGGKKLSDKYAAITYVDKQISDLKGGADGAYDTLKELQDAIQNNEGGIGTITTALGTKFDKTGGNVSGNVLASGRVEGELKHTKGYLTIQPYGSTYGDGNNRCRIYYKEHENGKPENKNRGLVIQSNDADGTSQPMDIWVGGQRVYHNGNRPTWDVIGGNSVIDITGTYNKLQRGYLCAFSEGTGFLPDQSSTTGRSRIGTSSWWFKESFVAKTFTQELNVGDSTNNVTIKKTGNKLQFLV
ncbi:MAG: hypothetical protein ACRC2Y_04475 [Aeromonas veronii]